WFFTSASSLLIVTVGWYLTDKVIEPRLKNVAISVEEEEKPTMDPLDHKEKKAFYTATSVMLLSLTDLFFWAAPESSAWRDANGKITSLAAPLMRSIVPLIFIIFLIPGVVYGLMSGVFPSTKDIVMSMSKAMSSMSYYIVTAFFFALFIDVFC